MQMQMVLIQFLTLLRQQEEDAAVAQQVRLLQVALEEVVAPSQFNQPAQVELLIKGLQEEAAARQTMQQQVVAAREEQAPIQLVAATPAAPGGLEFLPVSMELLQQEPWAGKVRTPIRREQTEPQTLAMVRMALTEMALPIMQAAPAL